MPFKILHLITSLEGGGTENFLYQLLRYSPEDCQNTVLYLKKNGVTGEKIKNLGIPVLRISSGRALYRFLRDQKPDILHTCLFRGNQVGRIIGTLAAVPRIISSQRAIDIWAKPSYALLDLLTLSLCDTVLVNSLAVEKRVRKRCLFREPRIVQITNGVDLQQMPSFPSAEVRRHFGLPDNAVIGGTLSRLHTEKGIDFLPAYASALCASYPQLHLVIAGEGPLRPIVEEQIPLSFRNRVHWLGWQENNHFVLSGLDFFFLLSREESFPQALLEAMAHGLPFVAPAIGDVPVLGALGSSGLLYTPSHIPEAVSKTKDLIQNLAFYREQAQKTIPFIQNTYDLRKTLPEVYDIFRGN